MKKIISILLTVLIIGALATVSFADTETNVIVLNGNSATIDGTSVKEYDYAWHVDPSVAHTDVKNSPAEYFSGTAPTGEDDIYIAHDIVYMPSLNESSFKKVQYDDDQEWAYYYTADGLTDYIFMTLPDENGKMRSDMMHTEDEAYKNAVLHITKAGTYVLKGTWNGQIKVDLGDDAFDDSTAVVTLILDNATIKCTVAPAINFYSVYECDNTWEDKTSWSSDVDLSQTGANIYITGTSNVTGANVYRMLKAKYKDDEDQSKVSNSVKLQKKAYKTDGAVYSYESVTLNGDSSGTLNITSAFEGLDSELHMLIKGGVINISSNNDGINVNEDNVSVFRMDGGTLNITAGTGGEGDGIDSNGYLVINGGTLNAYANPAADCGIDSDKGTYINGGTVTATGSSMDKVSGGKQASVMLNMSNATSAKEIIIKNSTSSETFKISDTRSFKSIILSSNKLSSGTTWNVFIDGSQYGYTTAGSDGQAAPGGAMPDNGTTPPDGNRPDDAGTPPEGMNNNGDTPPAKPDDNGVPGNDNFSQTTSDQNLISEFKLSDTVSVFNNVQKLTNTDNNKNNNDTSSTTQKTDNSTTSKEEEDTNITEKDKAENSTTNNDKEKAVIDKNVPDTGSNNVLSIVAFIGLVSGTALIPVLKKKKEI